MRDVFDYTAPLGPLGVLADRAFLTAYVRQFLTDRNRVLLSLAESPEGDQYLGGRA